MKNTIMMSIVALVIFGLTSTSFAEGRNKFMGVTYIVPDTTYSDVLVKDNVVKRSDSLHNKFMGATYSIPEQTYQEVSVKDNAVRNGDALRNKFMGATYIIKK